MPVPLFSQIPALLGEIFLRYTEYSLDYQDEIPPNPEIAVSDNSDDRQRKISNNNISGGISRIQEKPSCI